MTPKFDNLFNEHIKLKPGDKVENINSDCDHYKSKGTVKKVKNLPHDGDRKVKNGRNVPGQVVEYEVDNTSKNYEDGDKLTKTEIQLKKVSK